MEIVMTFSKKFKTLLFSLLKEFCPTLCDPINCSPPGSSVRGILQARVLEWCHFLLQRIFPTKESNLGLLHCRQTLYHLSPREVLFSILYILNGNILCDLKRNLVKDYIRSEITSPKDKWLLRLNISIFIKRIYKL